MKIEGPAVCYSFSVEWLFQQKHVVVELESYPQNVSMKWRFSILLTKKHISRCGLVGRAMKFHSQGNFDVSSMHYIHFVPDDGSFEDTFLQRKGETQWTGTRRIWCQQSMCVCFATQMDSQRHQVTSPMIDGGFRWNRVNSERWYIYLMWFWNLTDRVTCCRESVSWQWWYTLMATLKAFPSTAHFAKTSSTCWVKWKGLE